MANWGKWDFNAPDRSQKHATQMSQWVYFNSTGEDETDKGPIYVLRSAFNDFATLQRAVEERGITPLSAESEWVPHNTVELGEDETQVVLDLVDRLEQDEDVQRVFVNLA